MTTKAIRVLVPFSASEAITVPEAAKIARRSGDTVRRWAALHDLGRPVGGQWMLSRIALAMFLDGDRAALQAFLGGDRSSALVRSYIPDEN